MTMTVQNDGEVMMLLSTSPTEICIPASRPADLTSLLPARVCAE